MFGYKVTKNTDEREDLHEMYKERAISAIKKEIEHSEMPLDTKIHEFAHENKVFFFVLESDDTYKEAIEKFKKESAE
jgi:hypothetical protein